MSFFEFFQYILWARITSEQGKIPFPLVFLVEGIKEGENVVVEHKSTLLLKISFIAVTFLLSIMLILEVELDLDQT